MSTSERFKRIGNDSEELGRFDRIQNPHSKLPDLNAIFILRSKLLFRKTEKLIVSSDIDCYYLYPNEQEIELLEDADILDLIRCGVVFRNDRLAILVNIG